MALFLDVQSAYPTVHPDRLIHILVGFPLSIREDLTCRINQPLQTDKTAVNLSIVWENLLDFIQSNTEVIAVQMGAKIAPLTPNIVFQNMDLNRQEAVTNTHAIIERATDSDALIFTDGSYEKTKGGGAAALMMNTDESIWFRTGPDIIHSNHECEALGVLAALKLITTNEFAENFNCFTVFTDNRGVLSRMVNPLAEKPGQYIFSEMMKIACNIRPHSQISFVWCPGHAGIEGNERADRKASEAVVEGINPPIALSSNVTKVRRRILDGRTTASKTLAKKTPSMEIRYSAIPSQLASGSCSLNGYLFQIRKVLDPSCPYCGCVKESVTLFFNYCPAYKTIRWRLRKHLRRARVAYNPYDLCSALTNLKAWPALTTFIMGSNRFQSLMPTPDPETPRKPPESTHLAPL